MIWESRKVYRENARVVRVFAFNAPLPASQLILPILHLFSPLAGVRSSLYLPGRYL